MTVIGVPSGFLVVLTRPEYRGETGQRVNPRYSGVGRVPAYPSKYDEETEALDSYVFGGFKRTESNLIPTIGRAVELLKMFSASRRSYEIILCCEGPQAECLDELGQHEVKHLGYDVVVVTGDYWSIVDDFCASEWADRFAKNLNDSGLFSTRADAESYLRQYRRHKEADYDMPFAVVYVVRYSGDVGAP